jgi:hypothetical protein
LRQIIILTMVLFSLVFAFPSNGRKEKASHYLNLRNVITDPGVKHESDYEYGKLIYPRYKAIGLPDNFMIKKSPDLSFGSQELKVIRIARQSFSNVESYVVSIVFEASIGDKLTKYTKNKIGDEIAVAVDEYILVIARILDVFDKELTFTVTNRKLNEIEDKLSPVSRKIIIE